MTGTNYIVIIYPTANYRKLVIFGFFWSKGHLGAENRKEMGRKMSVNPTFKGSKQLSLTTYHVPEGGRTVQGLIPTFYSRSSSCVTVTVPSLLIFSTSGTYSSLDLSGLPTLAAKTRSVPSGRTKTMPRSAPSR